MSEKDPKIADSIKIALDAADTATSAASELDSIREDNVSVRGEMKKIYRSVVIVVISSLVGAAISLIASAVIYYRTLSEMEAANNTALESLVIFAENVDKLAIATKAVEGQAESLDKMTVRFEELQEQIAKLVETNKTDRAALLTGMEETRQAVDGGLAQYSRSVIEDLGGKIDESSTMVHDQVIETQKQAAKILALLGPSTVAGAPAGGMTKSQIEEIITSLKKVLLMQAEMSGKVSALAPKPQKRRAAPRKTRNTNSTQGMIKFP